jgi:ABC-type lipoprotein release transport system permease subunit
VTVSRLRTVADVDDINRDVVVRWAPGLDARAETRALERAVDSEVFLARLPSDLANLERVQALPWVLAAFLAIVAVLAIAHAVVSTVRRRRRDLAILRTLGLVDRQLSALVRWEGSTFAVIGLLVGIPLGVVAGRIVWQLVADRMGIDPAATLPVPAIVVIAVATMVVALAAAAIPARDARRVQPARTLAANG